MKNNLKTILILTIIIGGIILGKILIHVDPLANLPKGTFTKLQNGPYNFAGKPKNADMVAGLSTANNSLKLEITQDKYKLAFVQDLPNSTATQEKDSITYKTTGDADIKYQITDRGVKESIILNSSQEIKPSFVYEINLYNLNLEKAANGLWQFYDKNDVDLKQPLFKIPSPFMVDAKGARSEEVSFKKIEKDDKLFLELNVDEEWLKSKDRVYPVTIDPSVIAADATSVSGANQTTTPKSWSHTSTGTNLVLVVGIGHSPARTVTSVTYNGVNLTQIRTDVALYGTTPYATSELWYLVGPSTGANNITVTFDSSTGLSWAAGAITLTGVAQTAPEANNGAHATGFSQTPTVNVTTVADNSWVVDCFANYGDYAVTAGANQTQYVQQHYVAYSTAMAGSYEGPKTPAGAVTMSWDNVSPTAIWAISAASFAPAADATPTPTPAPGFKFQGLKMSGIKITTSTPAP